MNAETLAQVIRGETVESVHTGHIIILDGERNTVASIGEPSTVTYFRSACKAFQAIPCITSGAADAFGFTADKIAMACASHSGENIHVELASRMLEKVGLSESDLRCGVHIPFNETAAKTMMRLGEEPSQLHNNCSGKHAAMLAFAKHIGADLDTYNQADNRIQKRILRCIADFTELPVESIATGTDGCCAPNFAVPLSAMALSFVNLMSPSKFPEPTQKACARIVEAMMKYPELIGGGERLDTLLMQAAPSKIVSKVGADGVWCGAVLPCEKWPTGLGIALKVSDGDDFRGRPVIVVEILRQLGVLAANDLTELSPSPIKNRRGDAVGKVASAFDLAI